MTNTAPIKWAQRSDSLYVTIALPGMYARDYDDAVVLRIFVYNCESDSFIKPRALVLMLIPNKALTRIIL
jgi:hypothetical protein